MSIQFLSQDATGLNEKLSLCRCFVRGQTILAGHTWSDQNTLGVASEQFLPETRNSFWPETRRVDK